MISLSHPFHFYYREGKALYATLIAVMMVVGAAIIVYGGRAVVRFDEQDGE